MRYARVVYQTVLQQSCRNGAESVPSSDGRDSPIRDQDEYEGII